MSSNIKVQRICEHCGVQFTARTTKTRYCSHTCNSRAYKAKVRSQKVEKSNIQTIATIAKPIEEIKAREFLSISDVSNLIGISKRTVYRLIEKGELKYSKVGSRTIIKRTSLNRMIDLGERK